MKNIITKIIIIAGGILSIVGLFPIVGLYPSKMWSNPHDYWKYVLSRESGMFWKIAIVILCTGIILSYITKHKNRRKILIFNVLAIIISFITAFVGINRLMPSSSVILYPISVIFFIIALVCGKEYKAV